MYHQLRRDFDEHAPYVVVVVAFVAGGQESRVGRLGAWFGKPLDGTSRTLSWLARTVAMGRHTARSPVLRARLVSDWLTITRVIAAAVAVGEAITGAGSLGWALAQTNLAVTTTILGLGASVIIYLVLEELLREVHETDTGPIEVAVLFGFFLPFFLAGVASH